MDPSPDEIPPGQPTVAAPAHWIRWSAVGEWSSAIYFLAPGVIACAELRDINWVSVYTMLWLDFASAAACAIWLIYAVIVTMANGKKLQRLKRNNGGQLPNKLNLPYPLLKYKTASVFFRFSAFLALVIVMYYFWKDSYDATWTGPTERLQYTRWRDLLWANILISVAIDYEFLDSLVRVLTLRIVRMLFPSFTECFELPDFQFFDTLSHITRNLDDDDDQSRRDTQGEEKEGDP